ncbi:MAG TPA: hypothetical protein VFT51_03425 [Bacillales bacterium]|nr:hypothetical protein [Bacillales bacterium]
MDKKRRQEEELQYEEDGEMTVHQQITESYQSGVIDGRSEELREQSKKEK